jgi:hypothetical protein
VHAPAGRRGEPVTGPDQRLTRGQAGDAISSASGRARPPAGRVIFIYPRPRTNTSLP